MEDDLVRNGGFFVKDRLVEVTSSFTDEDFFFFLTIV
jgi:hypothetical protein